jgi:murein DD-endopeptidase MepM/ murein hydrolase activator NlpD
MSPVEIKVDDDVGFTAVGEYRPSSTVIQGQTPMTHTVLNNETLYDVAYKYNIDPMNLAQINAIKAPYKVKNGQVLKLPRENTLDETGDRSSAVPEENYAAKKYNSGDNEIPSYEEENEKDKKENYEKNKGDDKSDELEDEFEEVILKNNIKKQSSKTKKPTKDSSESAKEAEAWSKPPVVETALGGVPKKIKEKNDGENKEAVSENAGKNQTKKHFSEPQKSSKMSKPLEGRIIVRFGDVVDGVSSDGINIKAPLGTKVKSVGDGTVIYAGNKFEEDYGNIIMIRHSDGLVSSYAHLQGINVKQGAKVKAGEAIGSVGKTGDVTEPQLHLEIMKNTKPVDPLKYM